MSKVAIKRSLSLKQDTVMSLIVAQAVTKPLEVQSFLVKLVRLLHGDFEFAPRNQKFKLSTA